MCRIKTKTMRSSILLSALLISYSIHGCLKIDTDASILIGFILVLFTFFDVVEWVNNNKQ